uniref:Serine/arginine-rich splicing factor 2 n=1 Tax=Syphacia muris TaxID=451379 RepID=A0A158R4G5_9BILA
VVCIDFVFFTTFSFTVNAYRGSNIYRVKVPDHLVDWKVQWDTYKPQDYTSESLRGKPYADAEINTGRFNWNRIDGLVDRRSHEGEYSVDDCNRPLNPSGRTGLKGRGVLGRWGPNHAADCLVTRNHSGKLQFVGIERKDCGIWAIPGGMIEPNETALQAAKREFTEETLNIEKEFNLESLWASGRSIYKGYVDDPRNTDNSWMETEVFNFHDKNNILNNINFKAGDDAVNVRWLDMEPLSKLICINGNTSGGSYATNPQTECVVEVFGKIKRRPGPPSINGLYSLKIDNISYQTTPQDLRQLFEKYGEIGDIHIPRDRYTKQSKGFGFVRFYSRRDAEYAMDRMDGRWLDGREVRVAMARYERPIDERNARNSGYRRRRWSMGMDMRLREKYMEIERKKMSSRTRSRSRSQRRRRSRSSPSKSHSRSGSPRNNNRDSLSPRKSDPPRRSSSGEKSASHSHSNSPVATKNGDRSRTPSESSH